MAQTLPLIAEASGAPAMRLPLSVSLLRGGTTPLRAISPNSLSDAACFTWDHRGLVPLDLADEELLMAALPGDVVVVLFQRLTTLPAWHSFLSQALALGTVAETMQLDTQIAIDVGAAIEFGRAAARTSLGAVVFCATSARTDVGHSPLRWLAWPFGSGSYAMQRKAMDPRFGLLIALNTLVVVNAPTPTGSDADRSTRRVAQLRDLRYETTTPYSQQTGHRATRNIPVQGFRVDQQSDLISAAGGRTADPVFADVVGSRSLQFRAEVESIVDLVQLSTDVLLRSTERTYRDEFAWVDNISPVFEDDTVEFLRQELLTLILTNPTSPSIDVLLPDDLVDIYNERAICHILFPKERTSEGRINLTIAGIAGLVQQLADGGNADPLDAQLRFLDCSRELIGSSTVLECLTAELWLGSQQYIIYDGDFYQVDPKFLKTLDDELDSLHLSNSSVKLPCFEGGDEPTYNREAARNRPDLISLDRQLIRLPGQSGVETCDLMDASGALVHVKRKGKSAVLSQLFLQAATSCDLLSGSQEARAQLRTMIEHQGCSSSLRDALIGRLDTGLRGVEVVFAFLGDWKGRTITSLPLFSRISLLRAARGIYRGGYTPKIQLVDLCR